MHVFRFEHERKAILKKNTHRKEGLTVFTELNTGGELCKKDKLPSIYDASSVSYFSFASLTPILKKKER